MNGNFADMFLEAMRYEHWLRFYFLDDAEVPMQASADNELAVEATPNPNLNYLHSILTRWHEEGIKTPEDADRDRAARKEGRATPAPTTKSAPKTANPPKATSFDVDDFFAAAINRGYGNKK